MGIGVSLFLLAAGAILNFAIHVNNPSGVNIHTIGTILMIVGAIGVVVSMMFWSTLGWGGRRGTVVREEEIV